MKKLISLWLALVLVLALCACGSEPEQAVTSATYPATAATSSVAASTATSAATSSVASSATTSSVASSATTASSVTEKTTASTVPTRIDWTRLTEMDVRESATATVGTTATANTTFTHPVPTGTVKTDKTGATEETPAHFDTEEGYYYVVYLASGSYASIEMTEDGSLLYVKSSKNARLLDGTLFGPVCRTYDITDPDFSKETIERDIPDGTFYIVDHTGSILTSIGTLFTEKEAVSGKELVGTVTYPYSYALPTVRTELSPIYFDTMTVTSASGDTILATVGGKENVDITNVKVRFLYSDVDGTQFFTADDNTGVSLVNFDTAVSSIESAYKKAALAYSVYAQFNDDAGPAALAAKDAYEIAEKELFDAKQSVITKYFNGQFWGSGSLSASPLGVYFAKVQNTFNKEATLSFRYFENGGTLFVLVPTFVLG